MLQHHVIYVAASRNWKILNVGFKSVDVSLFCQIAWAFLTLTGLKLLSELPRRHRRSGLDK